MTEDNWLKETMSIVKQLYEEKYYKEEKLENIRLELIELDAKIKNGKLMIEDYKKLHSTPNKDSQ